MSMMRAPLVAIAAACCGCTTMPADPVRMSPEQLREWSKDKGVVAQCVLVTTPWGPQRSLSVSLDKSVIAAGSVGASPECEIRIQLETPKPAR